MAVKHVIDRRDKLAVPRQIQEKKQNGRMQGHRDLWQVNQVQVRGRPICSHIGWWV